MKPLLAAHGLTKIFRSPSAEQSAEPTTGPLAGPPAGPLDRPSDWPATGPSAEQPAGLPAGQPACLEVALEVHAGEVLGLVGESGSGKSTLLNLLCGAVKADAGQSLYRDALGLEVDLQNVEEVDRRRLMRSELGFVRQNPRDGLNMNVSAGANVAERLLAGGERRYDRARAAAAAWLERVEIPVRRLDDSPETYSGGMLQRLQIAKNLVAGPRLVFLDEPTGGLDVSVQARLLDLLRNLVAGLRLAVVLTTHDLAVARLLSHRILVMKGGRTVESGLTDQVLDDPQAPYTQLLTSSTLSL
ncbi:MAG: ATP-binding cassette domain-containing protein [Deltaproteobacteria bacterium]|jgi:putative phosphonate transport system ATP-binding protein|nr:ATP-binding cassette domain-containing protein [Deltaproteobacteria bacterium]